MPGTLRIPTGMNQVESSFPRQCPSAPRCMCTPAAGQSLISLLLLFFLLALVPSSFPPNMSQSFASAVLPISPTYLQLSVTQITFPLPFLTACLIPSQPESTPSTPRLLPYSLFSRGNNPPAELPSCPLSRSSASSFFWKLWLREKPSSMLNRACGEFNS